MDAVDRSTSETVVQYAVQFQFKNKSPSQAAKLTAERLGGSENMFLGRGVVHIDPVKLEGALWDNMVEYALQAMKNIKPSMESIAVNSTVQHFRLGSRDARSLAQRVVNQLGRPLDDSLNPFMKSARQQMIARVATLGTPL